MEAVGQRIALGGSLLGGIALAVLIGLTKPPNPQELVLAGARAIGVLSAGSVAPQPEKPPSPAGGSAKSGPGGLLPLSSQPTTFQPETKGSQSPHSAADPSPQEGQVFLTRGGEQTAGGASAERKKSPDRAHDSQQAGERERIALVSPPYGQQLEVPSAGGSSGGEGASAPASGAPPSPGTSPSASESTEVPRRLLELWRLMHKGRSSSSQEASSVGTASGEEKSETGKEPASADSSESRQAPSASLPSPGNIPDSSVQRAGEGLSPLKAVSATPASSSAIPKGSSASSQAEGSNLAQFHPDGKGRLIITIRNEDIRKVLEMLSEQGNLNILVTSSVQGKISATLTGVDLESALEAILRSAGYVARREGKFIYVGTPEDFLRMEQAADRIGTRVYRPNYVKASDLKDLIQPLLTEKVGLVSVSAPSEVGIGSDDDKAGGNNFAGAETVLVRDYESVLAQIDQVVAEIDVRPLQVHIQAMILSVHLDDTDKFGVDFKKLIGNSNFTIGWGLPVDSLSQVTFTQGGLKFGFIDGDVGAFLEALESLADMNVIAAPRLMVLNKHRADILIGRQEGYVNTTQTETASTQSVQFLDVGTQLRIRPFISPDGLIRMEIHPELSDGSVSVQGNFTLPQKEVTKVTTNIMVRDGCTVVIGGLMQEQAISNVSQIPFFGNLPVIGALFRRTTEELKRVEIIVLVTPHIVREPEAYAEGALEQCQSQRRHDVYLEKMSPLGKRSVARRYVRMAKQAWTEGDLKRALRFAEMAVHFDPLSREALEIRAQIWQRISAAPIPEEALPPPIQGDWTKPLDGPTVAPWILEQIEKPNQSPPTPTEKSLPELPSPPQIDGESPQQDSLPSTNTNPLGGDSSSNSKAKNELKIPSGAFPSPPPSSERGRTKDIRRPALFQSKPLKSPPAQ